MALAKNILIATDLSENAEVAETSGAALAASTGAKVTLFNSYDLDPMVPHIAHPSVPVVSASVEREVVGAIQKILDDKRGTTFEGIASVSVEIVRARNAAFAVCDYVKENDIDLVVVGTHGRTGLRHMLMGSVAERIVRHCPCPVLVAR
jgi:universal stress protein A